MNNKLEILYHYLMHIGNRIKTKVNLILTLAILMAIGIFALNLFLNSQIDIVEKVFLGLSIIVSAIISPLLFLKIINNYPNLTIKNGSIYYNNLFQSSIFIKSQTNIYLERKYNIDFLVFADRNQKVYVLVSEINEEFYHELIGVKH